MRGRWMAETAGTIRSGKFLRKAANWSWFVRRRPLSSSDQKFSHAICIRWHGPRRSSRSFDQVLAAVPEVRGADAALLFLGPEAGQRRDHFPASGLGAFERRRHLGLDDPIHDQAVEEPVGEAIEAADLEALRAQFAHVGELAVESQESGLGLGGGVLGVVQAGVLDHRRDRPAAEHVPRSPALRALQVFHGVPQALLRVRPRGDRLAQFADSFGLRRFLLTESGQLAADLSVLLEESSLGVEGAPEFLLGSFHAGEFVGKEVAVTLEGVGDFAGGLDLEDRGGEFLAFLLEALLLDSEEGGEEAEDGQARQLLDVLRLAPATLVEEFHVEPLVCEGPVGLGEADAEAFLPEQTLPGLEQGRVSGLAGLRVHKDKTGEGLRV